MSARNLENSQIKMKTATLHVQSTQECYLPQESGTGACMRQEAGLVGQMHHALGAELCKMAG